MLPASSVIELVWSTRDFYFTHFSVPSYAQMKNPVFRDLTWIYDALWCDFVFRVNEWIILIHKCILPAVGDVLVFLVYFAASTQAC